MHFCAERGILMQFAAHTFKYLDDAEFDISDYSRLKFGSNVSANKMGREMAIKFFHQHADMLADGNCLVTPSAYNMLEIAATLLARQFMIHLNTILVKHGMPIVKWTVMHRTITYFSDYAHMTIDERKKMLSGDSFFINKDFIQGKTLLIVDDVVITGTHEEKIKEFLKTENIPNKCMYLYYCKYTGKCAETEAKLNTHGVNDANSYLNLINEPNHQIIVRTCKFLLNGSSDQLITVLSNSSADFVNRLYSACILEEYHAVPRYRDNMAIIEKFMDMK